MTDPRRAALLLGIGTIVLVIGTACAAPPPPLGGTPTPTGDGVSLANDGAEPLPVLPIGCADVLPLEQLQTAIPAPLEVWADESTTPQGITLLQYRQAGGLHCVWGGEGGTDGVPDVGVQLWISPDAADDFRDHATTFLYPEEDVLITDTVGDGSVIDCGSGEFTGLSCTGDVLAGDWWILLSAQAEPGDERAYDTAVTDMTALTQGIIDTVASAGESRAVWSPPESVDGSIWCADPAVASLALGVDADGLLGDPLFPSGGIDSVAHRAAGAQCVWSATGGDATAVIRTLQGGAWAFERLAAEGIGAGEPFPGDAEPVDTAVDGALVACGDGCNAVLLVGGSLVAIREIGFDAEAAAAAVRQIAEVMAAGA